MEDEVVITEANKAVETISAVGEEIANQTKSFWHVDDIAKYCTLPNIIRIAVALLSILIFTIIYKIIKKITKTHIQNKFGKHVTTVVEKVIKYIFYVIIGMYILNLFGIDLKAIWGAAGIAGVAIGFAAQTSISNLISGIFIMTEHAMKVGDFITLGDISGTIDSIGLLSTRIKTLDSQIVRVPNSSIINGNLTNFNKLPVRRFVFSVPVAYESNMEKVLEVCQKIPSLCPTVLQDPAPAVFYDGFETAIMIKIAVWFKTSDLIQVKNEMYVNIVNELRKNDIEIPYEKFDIKLINDKDETKAAKAKPKAAAKQITKTAEKKSAKTKA